jgi:hypothetical protein
VIITSIDSLKISWKPLTRGSEKVIFLRDTFKLIEIGERGVVMRLQIERLYLNAHDETQVQEKQTCDLIIAKILG